MEGAWIAIFVPTVLFMLIVAPVWIFMHYRSKQKSQDSLTADERAELETLAMRAEMMLERIDTLESILDAQTPDWRKRNNVE